MTKAAEPVPPKKRGRPPKPGTIGPRGGKGSVFTARIDGDVRRALDVEAARTGKTVGQVADAWLSAASKGRAQYLDLVGGDAATGAAIEMLVGVMRSIDAVTDDPVTRHDAKVEAWKWMAPFVVPHGAPRPNELKMRDVEDRFWMACGDVLTAVESAGVADPVFIRAIEPVSEWPSIGFGLLTRPVLNAERLADALDPQTRKSVSIAQRGLQTLREGGGTAAAEIERALSLAEKYLALFADFGASCEAARRLGRAAAKGAVFG